MELSLVKTSIWQQFGAVIDYLGETIRACPDELWQACLWENPNERAELAQFWYRAYHTLFWIDAYLTGTEEGFLPPPPFMLIEQDEHGPIPERAYTKAELLDYVKLCRQRCKATIDSMTEEAAARQCAFGWGTVTFVELLIYSLRHVQEHSGQLNLMLGQHGVHTPDYPVKIKGEA